MQEQYLVTARKWRPLNFDEVVGQEHITTTLKNAINNKRIHHALLFCGPRGVGKTTTARIYARAVNFPELIDQPLDNVPDAYKAIMNGTSMDIIEIDGASNNSVDDIRKLRENSKYPPSNLKYKMYIIDEVHMLSTSAFNALLKTLEEPPPHLLFVFATTESHKVPATIISRCQKFDFKRIEIDDITTQLAKIAKSDGIEIDEQSLITISKKADGSMRDAQSIYDQAIAFCGKNVQHKALADALQLIDEEFFFKLSDLIHNKKIKELYEVTLEIITKGYDLQEVLQGLLEHYRNISAIKLTGDTSLLNTSNAIFHEYLKISEKYEIIDLLRLMNLISQAEQNIKYAPIPRIKFELTMTQLALMDSTLSLTELLSEMNSLKKNLNPNSGQSINLEQKRVNQNVSKSNTNINNQSTENQNTKSNEQQIQSEVQDSHENKDLYLPNTFEKELQNEKSENLSNQTNLQENIEQDIDFEKNNFSTNETSNSTNKSLSSVEKQLIELFDAKLSR